MRRLTAILLLFVLPLRTFLCAAEPYCQHEHGQASAQHLASQAWLPADTGGLAIDQAPVDAHGHVHAQTGATTDHGHHCCAPWVLLPLPHLPVMDTTATSVLNTLPAPALSSVDPGRIERPNWPRPH